MNKKRILLGALACIAAVILSGCGKDAAHYEEVKKKAVRYYKEKYGDSVTVENSYQAGNSGLFGYIGVKDRAYELSDGVKVYWNEAEQYYADNRQAEEIAAAMREVIMQPAIAALGDRVNVSKYSFNRTGMESFDECVFTAFYDGDIRKFAGKEKIRLNDFKAVITEQHFKKKAERFIEELDPYIQDSYGSIYVVPEDYAGEPDVNSFGYSAGNPAVRAVGSFSSGEGVRWIENIFVEAAPGILVSSGIYDLVLEPGDVTFVEAGTTEDLQKKLDDGYYAMPEEAEENKNGGYTVRDRKHEKRAVLTNTGAPVYRLQISERVRERADSNGKVSLYFMMDRPQEQYLWYYTDKPPYTYTLFRLAESGGSRGDYAYMEGEELLYFGSVEWKDQQSN